MSFKTHPKPGDRHVALGMAVTVVEVVQSRRGPVLLLNINDRREWMTLAEWRRWWRPFKGDPPRPKPPTEEPE